MSISKESKKDSFLLYLSHRKFFERLDDTGKAKLIMSLFDYAETGEEIVTDNGKVEMAFVAIQDDLDRNAAKYLRQCERNRENGKLGGRPKGKSKEPTEPTGFYKSFNDYDNDCVYESEERDINISPKKRFVKPTVEEVRAYCLERHNFVDPEAFVDFYESKGWKVGDQPMKDWKACVRTWERSESRRTYSKPDDRKGQSRGTDYDAMIAQGICAEYAPVAQRVS